MIEFSTCCFCLPLRAGCVILGYLHVIASIILGFLSILTLVALSAVVDWATDDPDVEVDESAFAAIVAISVIMLILVTVLLTFSILLVVGINKGRRSFVKAYLIYYLIFIILYSIMFIVRCATLPLNIFYIIGTLIHIWLSVYFLLVIRSYWVTMGDKFNSANK